MKILYEDILRLLKQKPSIQDLSDKLFQLGHEHEIYDNIFDIEFTPNRGDCLSIFGIARDLNVFFSADCKFEVFNEEIEELNIEFKNECLEICPKISFLEIEIVSIPNKSLIFDLLFCQYGSYKFSV